MTTLEVIDAIQRSLYTEGFLQSIRAQLRAKVFQIISKGPDYASSNSENILNFSKSESGILSLMIVKDFLNNLNLKETLSVFEIEAGIESQNRYKNEEIEKLLKIDTKVSTGFCILDRIVNSFITDMNVDLNDSYSDINENIVLDTSSQLHEGQNIDENNDSYNDYHSEMKMSEGKIDSLHNDNDTLNLTKIQHFSVIQSDVNEYHSNNIATGAYEELEEDIQEEVPEYESDDEYNAKSPKQPPSPANRIFAKSNNEFGVSDITSKVNVHKLNQNSTSRSQKGWNFLDENSDDHDEFSFEKEPAEIKLKNNTTDIIFDEFDDLDDDDDDNDIKIEKYNDESILNFSYRSNQQEEEKEDDDENTSYRLQNPKQAFERNLSDKNNVQFDNDEEYADEDFDEDFEEEEGNINTIISNQNHHQEAESVEEEIISVEEELSIGEDNSNDDNDEYSFNNNKNKSTRNGESIMFRSRSGALPVIANTKASFNSLLNNEEDVDVDSKIPNISARMREIDQKLEDLENQDKDGSLLKLRKQHETEDNSVTSEDLDAMEFSTGVADEDDNEGVDVFETADSSGEGSFSFLDSSSKSGRK